VEAVGVSGVSLVLPGGKVITVPVAAGTTQPGSNITLGIRPEHIRIGQDGQFEGQAILAERLGGLTILHVDTTSEQSLVVQTDGSDTTPLHSPITLRIEAANCHLFDGEGKALARLS
jgi:multiple sugar transport system ATP-binding protein